MQLKAILFTILFITPLGTPAAQRPTSPATVGGEVRDQTGAVVVAARIGIIQIGTTDERANVHSASSDEQGRFRFGGLAPGTYRMSVAAEGFSASESEVTTRAGETAQITITLYPADVVEAVDVGSDSAADDLFSPERAAGTQVLGEREIESLPDDPDRLRERLQLLATTAGGVPGEAIVTVDGFLTSGGLPSKSSIREVRVNPDLYSAEYDTPPYRGGRIEVYTKPGAERFRGTAFFNLNDATLNARHPFAPTRAPTSTRRYGVQLGGPLIKKRAGFFVDFERRDIDEAATINALVLDDAFGLMPFAANVSVPQRLTIGSARGDWQINPAHTLIARYDFNRNRFDNQGVGGFDLAERAATNVVTEHSLRFIETAVVGPTILNELRIAFTRLRPEQRAASRGLSVVVPGAFSSGGASLLFLGRDERRTEILDYLSTSRGEHTLKLGVQIINRRTREQREENPEGTFFFGGAFVPDSDAGGGTSIYISGIEQYRRTLLNLPGGVPTRFTVTRGRSDVEVNQWRLAGFVQDAWRVRPNVSLTLGLRYEAQTAPTDRISFAPRLGIAYSPDAKQRWVLRGRAGLFYDRVADALTLEASRLDGVRQQQFFVDAPSFSDPLGGEVSPVTTTRRLDLDLRPPTSSQMHVEVERQLPRGWRVSASHAWTRGWSQIRSRNINAPPVRVDEVPSLDARPFGSAADVLQFESSGRTAGRVLFVGAFQTTNKRFTIASGYLNFDFRTNADTPFLLPQSSYSDAGEFAAPFWQSRHRVFLTPTFNLPYELRAAVTFNAASGSPLNVTTGRDANGDGNFNDRPNLVAANTPSAIRTPFGWLDPAAVNGNLPRNVGTNPATATLDLNLSRTFALDRGAKGAESRFKLSVNAAAYNLLNRTNPLAVSGVLASPFFLRPNAAAPARRIDLGVRLAF